MEKASITGNFSIEHRPFHWFLGLRLGLYTLHVPVRLLAGLWHVRGGLASATGVGCARFSALWGRGWAPL